LTSAHAADRLREAGDAGGGQRVEELFERPGRVKVGRLLLEAVRTASGARSWRSSRKASVAINELAVLDPLEAVTF
jgi:hypothetical protein